MIDSPKLPEKDAKMLAGMLKSIPGFSWDDSNLDATAMDLVRWCHGAEIDGEIFWPQQQAMWLVNEARETWEKWQGTAAFRSLFMAKFERRKQHPEQNVFDTAELERLYGPPDPEWSHRLVNFPSPTGNPAKDHRAAVNAMRYQAIRDCLYYTEGKGRLNHDGDAKERRKNEAFWQEQMDRFNNGKYVDEVKFLRAAIAAGRLDAVPPLPEYNPTAKVRSLTQEEYERLTPAEPAQPTDKRCVECGGTGRLAGDDYCSCRMGRDLRRIES